MPESDNKYRDAHTPYTHVCNGEEEGTGVECVGNRHRHAERDCTGRKSELLHLAVASIGSIKRPGELAPCEPHEPERHRDLSNREPCEAVVQETDQLGHREDEDQVEKQLDPGDSPSVRCRNWIQRHYGGSFHSKQEFVRNQYKRCTGPSEPTCRGRKLV